MLIKLSYPQMYSSKNHTRSWILAEVSLHTVTNLTRNSAIAEKPRTTRLEVSQDHQTRTQARSYVQARGGSCLLDRSSSFKLF